MESAKFTSTSETRFDPRATTHDTSARSIYEGQKGRKWRRNRRACSGNMRKGSCMHAVRRRVHNQTILRSAACSCWEKNTALRLTRNWRRPSRKESLTGHRWSVASRYVVINCWNRDSRAGFAAPGLFFSLFACSRIPGISAIENAIESFVSSFPLKLAIESFVSSFRSKFAIEYFVSSFRSKFPIETFVSSFRLKLAIESFVSSFQPKLAIEFFVSSFRSKFAIETFVSSFRLKLALESFVSSFQPKLAIEPFVSSFRLKLAIESFVSSFRLKLAIESFVSSFLLKLAIESFVSSFRLKLAIESLVSSFRSKLAIRSFVSSFRLKLAIEFFVSSFRSKLAFRTRCATNVLNLADRLDKKKEQYVIYLFVATLGIHDTGLRARGHKVVATYVDSLVTAGSHR